MNFVMFWEIEDGELDEHEGSFKVGKLLKDNIDTAMRHEQKMKNREGWVVEKQESEGTSTGKKSRMLTSKMYLNGIIN